MTLLILSYTWFEQPIVASSEPIENFKYFKNTCPSSEKVGKQIINIPCNFDESFLDFMSINLIKTFNKNK